MTSSDFGIYSVFISLKEMATLAGLPLLSVPNLL
jgi:hypothetical protein